MTPAEAKLARLVPESNDIMIKAGNILPYGYYIWIFIFHSCCIVCSDDILKPI